VQIPITNNLEGILRFEYIYKLEVSKIMHIIWNKQHPENLNPENLHKDIFPSFQHDRSTRPSSFSMFSTPLLRTSKLKQSLLSVLKGN